MKYPIETFTFMNRDEIASIITIDWKNMKVFNVENFSEEPVFLPFSPFNSNPTMDDFDTFLESRCFDETNGQAKKLLNDLELDYFNPLSIVRKTYGRNFDDHQWIQFEGEQETYESILCKNRDSDF